MTRRLEAVCCYVLDCHRVIGFPALSMSASGKKKISLCHIYYLEAISFVASHRSFWNFGLSFDFLCPFCHCLPVVLCVDMSIYAFSDLPLLRQYHLVDKLRDHKAVF